MEISVFGLPLSDRVRNEHINKLEWIPRADKRSRGRPPTRIDDLKRIATNWIATERNGDV